MVYYIGADICLLRERSRKHATDRLDRSASQKGKDRPIDELLSAQKGEPRMQTPSGSSSGRSHAQDAFGRGTRSLRLPRPAGGPLQELPGGALHELQDVSVLLWLHRIGILLLFIYTLLFLFYYFISVFSIIFVASYHYLMTRTLSLLQAFGRLALLLVGRVGLSLGELRVFLSVLKSTVMTVM